MNEQADSELLETYANGGCEAAFEELVGRHVDFVYSAALRMVRDPHLAEDVTQAVFVALGQRAGHLKDRKVLSGWLHRTAQNIAAQTVRTIERRRAREQKAVVMNEIFAGGSDVGWSEVAPHLDAAIGDLNETDREALLLRFFERRSARDIGATLGISDEAAQKRVNRAVERLRELFIKRGITVSASSLATLVSANAVQSAPAGLILTVSTGIGAVVKIFAMTTLQKALAVTAVAAVVGTGILQSRQASALQAELKELMSKQAPLATRMESLEGEHEQTERVVAALQRENQRLKAESEELLRLRGEVASLRREPTASAPKNDLGADGEEGRELGLAVVRGEPAALEKLTEYSRTRRNAEGMRAAFKVIEEAALINDPKAIDAVARGLLIEELKVHAALCIGKMAGQGNDDLVAVLLEPNYGFLLSTTVHALQPAAENGNQKAIEALAEVTREPKNQALWYMAAQGLSKAAGLGNPTAVAALIGLSHSTNTSVRPLVVHGLEAAANKQNAEALEALRELGLR